MKLLLDEMFTEEIAIQLQRRGHDVTSVQGQEPLMSLIDAALFAVAQTQRRVLVTENVADFLTLDARYRERQLPHVGVILTTNRQFSRRGVPALGGSCGRWKRGWPSTRARPRQTVNSGGSEPGADGSAPDH